MWFVRKQFVSFVTPLRIVVEERVTLPPRPRGIFELTIGNQVVRGENMASTMTAGTKASAVVKWVDMMGHPAKVSGDTHWETSDDEIVTVEVDHSDSNHATITSVGPVGPAQIQATVDSDLSENVHHITALLDLTVISGQAVAGVIELTPHVAEPLKAKK
jgi:hypothetical protein